MYVYIGMCVYMYILYCNVLISFIVCMARVCVCVCVFMYVCMYVCTCVCVAKNLCVGLCLYLCVPVKYL